MSANILTFPDQTEAPLKGRAREEALAIYRVEVEKIGRQCMREAFDKAFRVPGMGALAVEDAILVLAEALRRGARQASGRATVNAQVIKFTGAAATTRNIELVWELRTQAIKHIRAIEDLCDQIGELPHVWGVLWDSVGDYLEGVESMLTPTDMDEDDVKELEAESATDDLAGEDLAEWRAWLTFREAKHISL